MNLIVYALLAMFVVYAGIVWIVLARRRRARIRSVKRALLRHEPGDAWDRLGKSSAGSP
jgi:cbb3-type cytochrome oxidase subunit 3